MPRPLLLRFAQARDGLAAIEFAIVAPVLAAAMFGAFELTQMVEAKRRLENVAASVSDIVSRDTSVSNPELADLWIGAPKLIYPQSSTNLKVLLTSVKIDVNKNVSVLWEESHNGAPKRAGAAVTLPAGLLTADSGLIMTEVSYVYTSPLQFLFKNIVTLTHVEYRKPRLSDTVARG